MSWLCEKPKTRWTYFMTLCSNYNTQSVYHFEISAIVALKTDIVYFLTLLNQRYSLLSSQPAPAV